MKTRFEVLLVFASFANFAWGAPGVAQDAAPAVPEGLNLRMVAEIGGDFVDVEYLFQRVGPVAVAEDGEIYVLDIGDGQVKVFNPAGTFLRRIGRYGRGPGEFMSPMAILVDSQVRVFDGSHRRVVVFHRDGSHLATRPIPAISQPPPWIIHQLRGGGLLGEIPSMVGGVIPS